MLFRWLKLAMVCPIIASGELRRPIILEVALFFFSFTFFPWTGYSFNPLARFTFELMIYVTWNVGQVLILVVHLRLTLSWVLLGFSSEAFFIYIASLTHIQARWIREYYVLITDCFTLVARGWIIPITIFPITISFINEKINMYLVSYIYCMV